MAGLKWQRLSVLACAVALGPVTNLLAQDASTGVVRISDRGGVKPTNFSKGEYNAPPAAVYGGHAAGGYVGGGGYGVGGGYGADCYGGDCYGGKHKHGCFSERYCKNSPDHGFSVPGKWPIHRRGVQYTSYYPQTWGGGGVAGAAVPAYPMVYMPTDTTQLGFYYQHVPFWQPQPNPLPRRPIPAQWHHYAPTVSASDWGGGFGYGTDGVVVDGTVIQQGTPTPINQPAAQPAPQQAQPAVPQPPMDPPKPLPPAPEGAI